MCLVVLLITSCKSIKPVYKPVIVKEYNQPFLLSEAYQASTTMVTELKVVNNSDVVQIKQEPEYVYWDSSLTAVVDKHSSATPLVKKRVEKLNPFIIESLKSPAKVIKNVACKKIYCDSEKAEECGAIAWCDGDFCEKDKKLAEFYDCSGKDCIAKYADMLVVDSSDCDDPLLLLHPSCLGKGDMSCAGHNELFYCNNIAKACKN